MFVIQPTNGSSSLVILTKTRTDGEGRRHSVAVPLLSTPAQAQAGLVNMAKYFHQNFFKIFSR